MGTYCHNHMYVQVSRGQGIMTIIIVYKPIFDLRILHEFIIRVIKPLEIMLAAIPFLVTSLEPIFSIITC